MHLSHARFRKSLPQLLLSRRTQWKKEAICTLFQLPMKECERKSEQMRPEREWKQQMYQ